MVLEQLASSLGLEFPPLAPAPVTTFLWQSFQNPPTPGENSERGEGIMVGLVINRPEDVAVAR